MDTRGFFGSLFDYSFSSFVTPRIIKVLYVLATVLISLWTLFLAAAAFNVSETAGALTLFVVGPLFFIVSMLYARVVLELVIVFFRINGNVQEIRDERIGGAPQLAPRLDPPPDDAPVVAPAESLLESEAAPVVAAAAIEPSPEATIHFAELPAEPDAAAASTRYCENCGAERRPEGRFCTSCGQA
jgi:hypothetical protein